jgi:hypothetical protein
MRRMLPISLALLLLTPVAAMAGMIGPRPIDTAPSSITLVDGWWEQEHHDDAPDRYRKLPPPKLHRYDQLQAEQARRDAQRRKLAEQDRAAQAEQHRILGFQVTVH